MNGCRKMMLLVISLVLLAGVSSGFGQMKIRYINSERILQEYAGAQEIQKQLDELRSTYEAEYTRQENELKKLAEEIQNQSLLLSPDKKAEKEQQARQKQAALEKYYYDKLGPQGEYFAEYQKKIKPLQEKINDVLVRVGEDDGYDYILDIVQGVVVYYKPDHDITDRVLDELNKTK
ncbi:MAG: OmpH family outer membrane protein [Calditrichaeota bacterium]|nr:OmpH family outer membrane protein [Calditrichota bacterium]MCB0289670.1 OmpH family outer membrane protein [Calditrichota bacterium]MCB0294741.1 OmpH family outer membrane protein [Calditrichota bacterium]MCB0312191.1 OmpH family outer membrane protein [Calditrichota bacterium]MCB9090127.1 OmpH family outer membrane protein [Calditrichia bacterium]